MHYQPDIHTISKSAPPSYAEAMAQMTPKNNSYAPPYGQPTTTTTSDQSSSQMTGYPSCLSPNDFYSCQPAYNPSYVTVESTTTNQQCQQPTSPNTARIETIGRRKRYKCTTCNKIVVFITTSIIIIYLIKVLIF